MASFLFAATPAAGHVNPAHPLVRTLVDDGHRVRFTTGRALERGVERAGAEFVPFPAEIDHSVRPLNEFFPERARHDGVKQFLFDLEHVFIASIAAQVRHLQGLLEEPTDVLVADTALLSAPLVRELGGPPTATYGITVVTLLSVDTGPFGLGLRPTSGVLGRVRNRLLNAVVRKTMFAPTAGQLDAQRRAVGLPARKRTAVEVPAPDRFIQLSPAGFEYPRSDRPSWLRFVGHPAPLPPAEWVRPSWWDDVVAAERPVVVVTQGTVATDPSQLLRPSLAALADEDVLVVAVTGGADPSVLEPVPPNARVERYVPFDELFRHASAVVTNGGFGTVQLAIAHGVPLVAAGKTEDKVEVTARVAWSGVGVDLRTQTPSEAAIRSGVRKVLADPSFAAAARRLGEESDGAHAARRATDELLSLVAVRR
ncbi:glycosyltransferase [Cryptosporangium phraense]|uniref:Glycosyl transferase n=1 Tax=Cryptosporangium phraense TaxID=2593070 RepID=A0A545AWJ6_9ACTN|nr:nucleotide disphospho-sugar-binding domain-containing protein [Cryptosporangium phraense]TQS45702.1 glycosyl transferase [Cryptosporangium phraense]